MLTYSFTNLGSEPLYQHLYKCIKNDILQGVLVVGEKLPSKRSFAKNLGISTITVENAYAQLISEGYLYSIPKKGFFVADCNVHVIRKENSELPEITVNNLHLTAPNSTYFVDFSSNQTDLENFPFSIWAKLIRELLNENRLELLTNPPSGGILSLRKAISDHLLAFRGMHVLPEQIIIGAGTEYLYSLLIQLLGNDKDYGVEDPGYKKISQIYKSHGVSCHFLAMDYCGVQISELENSRTDIVHISPSHHFPTGKIMPISRRYELLGWASKSPDRYIIEDDYDSEFRLTGQPIPTLQSIDISGKVIYINTFTKSLASTIRISYMILPRDLLQTFYKKLAFYSCTVSNFEQFTLAHFISQGHFEKHINRMRNFYHHKRDVLLTTMKKSPLWNYITISEEDAGLHFLMKADTPLSDEEFCLRASEQGIHITSLSQYYQTPPVNSQGVFLINYSSVPEDRMKEAVDRIYKGCIAPKKS